MVAEFALYRRLLRQARPYWPHLGGLFLVSLLASPLALLTPLPLKMAVDSLVGSQGRIPGPLETLVPAAVTSSHTATLVVAAALFVIISLLTQLQQLGSSVLSSYTGEKLVLDFRVRLFRHVQRLSLLYHDSKGTTDSTYRIQYDAVSIQNITVNGVFPFITAAITIASMIYVTARIDWQLALVALAVSPALFLVAQAYRRRLRRQWGDAKKLESSAMSVIQEVLAAMRVVKAFGQEDHEQERFICQSSKGIRARIHLAFVAGSFGLLVGLITAVGTAVVLFIGMRHVQAGVLTLGELLMVMSYLAQLYSPLQTISKRSADLQASLASAERAFALLDEVPDVTERPHARPLARTLGAVTFRNVSFAYSIDHSVLHDISFEIGPGTHLGIAGTTGAGKTTLVSLLTRFYDPTAGQILLDGVDLRDYKLADLRNQFTIVLQEPVLFSSSIAENIAYARPGASYHDIVAAAKAANAHEFIVGLPQGYETQVGERGMRLSGGERQRISLARAFLKDAPILVLDEPTSSVDTKTEAVIMEAMERLMHGRTTFIIAHRLGTLANCDARLQIEQGRLVELTSAEDITEKQQIIRPTLPVQQAVLVVPEHEQTSSPIDLTDSQWQRIAPLVPPSTPNGHQHKVEPREAAGHETEAVAHGAGDEPVIGAEPMAKDATIEIVTLEHTTSLKSLAHQPLLLEGEHSATAYEKTRSTMDKQRQESTHSADESREKSKSQHIPRFFQSRALLIIGLVLLLALGGIDSMKLLSLSQHSSGTTAPPTSVTHAPLATRTAHVTPTVTTATPAARNASPPPTATAMPRNGLSIAGTYNGSVFDRTTQQTTYISVFLVQSEGNAALSGTVTFKSLSQGVHPLHGTVDTHGTFSFTVQLSAGQAPFYFYGTVQQQGFYLKGHICRSSTNSCSVNTGYFFVGPRY